MVEREREKGKWKWKKDRKKERTQRNFSEGKGVDREGREMGVREEGRMTKRRGRMVGRRG